MTPITRRAAAMPRMGHAIWSGIASWRLTTLSGAWAVIGYMQCSGAPLAVACAAMTVGAGLGALVALGTVDDVLWGRLGAAVVLLASPVLQHYWAMGREEPTWERLAFLKTLLVISGLLVLARLGAGLRRPAG
jgi:hypothetical protein